MTAIQNTKFSVTDHIVDKRDFETLAVVIMKGNLDHNLGTLRRCSKLFHRSIVLNIDHRNELAGCVLDGRSNTKCFRDEKLFNIDQHVHIPKHFLKREKGILKVILVVYLFNNSTHRALNFR